MIDRYLNEIEGKPENSINQSFSTVTATAMGSLQDTEEVEADDEMLIAGMIVLLRLAKKQTPFARLFTYLLCNQTTRGLILVIN
jgi:hypothetical protein